MTLSIRRVVLSIPSTGLHRRREESIFREGREKFERPRTRNLGLVVLTLQNQSYIPNQIK
jgi:hypothetical protein